MRSEGLHLVRRAHRLIAPAMAVLLSAASAFGQEMKRQAPPEFTSYFPPTPASPPPRAEMFAFIDVGVLAVVLCLTAYFLLAQRSRKHLRLLVVFAALYFGLYRQGCVCAVGSIQNVALALATPTYRLPFSAGAVFVLPLVAALFFGRVFCGAACPLGAIQDLVVIRPRRIPARVEHLLGVLPYLYLGLSVALAATGVRFLICKFDPFIAFYRLGGSAPFVAFGAAVLLAGTIYARPYCRFLCPYGVLLRWASAFARWNVHITPSECVQCHLCADACPFGAIHPPTPADATSASRSERRRVTRLLLTLPAAMAALATVGWFAGGAASRLDRSVVTADRVWLEDQGQVRGQTNESRAFRNLGQRPGVIYHEAMETRRRVRLAGAWFGAWTALIIVLRLVAMSRQRRHTDYTADPAACLSCARCYRSCPVEHARLTGLPVETIIQSGAKPE